MFIARRVHTLISGQLYKATQSNRAILDKRTTQKQ